MKTTMANKTSQDFSSRKHFHWTIKVENQDDEEQLPKNTTTQPEKNQNDKPVTQQRPPQPQAVTKRRLQGITVSRLRSALTTSLNKIRPNTPLGPRVVGTLFGSRNGHVHFAFQKDPTSHPAFLIELATPISGLVKEMASGLVRIALECNKKEEEKQAVRLLEEPLWRTYCNGKRCGFGSRRECGPKEWKVLKAVMMISMGAGVLPGSGDGDDHEDEVMYMRAKFERVVGSRDSEAFYMMNPDSNGAPELSIYLLRV